MSAWMVVWPLAVIVAVVVCVNAWLRGRD